MRLDQFTVAAVLEFCIAFGVDLYSVVEENLIFPVVIAEGKHLFPFRTEPLSPLAPMVLLGSPSGRVGRCRIFLKPIPSGVGFFVSMDIP